MKTLAEIDTIFGDPFQAPQGHEGKPRELLNHVMLFYELGLIDMLIDNTREESKEQVAEAVMSRVYSSSWLFRMEPQEFFRNYLENWVVARFEQRAKESSARRRQQTH